MKYSLEIINGKTEEIFAKDCNVWELDQPIPEVKKLIKKLETLLIETRELVSNNEVDIDTEMYCFKVVKPQILGRILFLKEVIYLKSEEMFGMVELNKSALNRKSKEIEDFIEENKYLLRYLRSEETKLDKHYFTRDFLKHHLHRNTYCCNCHSNFTTDVDMEWAQLVCYEILVKYITYRHQVMELEDDLQMDSSKVVGSLTWTKKGVDLVELAYALYSSGAFNRGNAEVIEIVRLLELCFNVKVGDCYKTYRYCRGRKKDRVPFLNQMRNSLIEKMDSDDE